MGASRMEDGLGSRGLAPRCYNTVQPHRRQICSRKVLVALLQSHFVMFPSGRITFIFHDFEIVLYDSVTMFICLAFEQDHKKSCRRDRPFWAAVLQPPFPYDSRVTRTAESSAAYSNEVKRWLDEWCAFCLDSPSLH